MAKGEKVIKVYDKDGRYLSLCSIEIRDKLIKRRCAVVISNNEIRLKVNDKDKKELKEEVIERDNRVCYICGERIPDDEIATIDHVRSKFKYGQENKKNLKCSCVRCNKDKGIMSLKQYVRVIKRDREKYDYISKSRLQYLERLAVTYDTFK